MDVFPCLLAYFIYVCLLAGFVYVLFINVASVCIGAEVTLRFYLKLSCLPSNLMSAYYLNL